MEKAEVALAKFSDGYNCAQSVIYSFCDDLQLDKEMALKISSGFGAGMSRREEVCGAVTGGIMVIGIKYGRGENGELNSKEQTYQKTWELMERFKEKHGTYICRQLLNGCELTTSEGQKEFKDKNLFNNVCMQCVGSVVEIVEDLLKPDN